MNILSISNFKGGVGKTSITVNFAHFLASEGHRVLCIDLDPQSNLTQIFDADPEDEEETLFDLLTGQATFGDVVKNIPVPTGKIHLLPSSVRLALADAKLAIDYGQKGGIERLKIALDKHRSKYDFVLCDCSPSIGMITQNAFKISDYVLIPTLTEYLAVRGIETMREAIEVFRKSGLNPNLQIGGFILSRYDSRAIIYREIKEGLEGAYGELIFKTPIRVSVAISKAQAAKESVFDFEPESRGAQDMKALFTEICSTLKLVSYV